MIATCLLAAVVAAAPAPPAPARSPVPTQPTTTNVGVLWIRATNTSYDALEDEIRLRLPEVELAPYGEKRPTAAADTLTVFIDVRPDPENALALALTLIASDGRAYDRIIALEPGATPEDTRELVARNIANLVFGIESGTVPPDRADVPIPLPEPRPEPACPEPARVVAPVTPRVAEAPRSPVIEIGPAVSLGAVTALGPPAAFDRFAAWGGEFDLGLRWRRGGALVLGLRTTGRTHPNAFSIVRFRVAVGGGYVWRPGQGAFELEALAGASIEPWITRDQGQRVDFSTAELPVIGGWARLAPGWLVRGRNRSIAARIGAFAELTVAYAPSSRGLVAIRDADRNPLFRVGGPELAFGLQTRLWFPVW